MATVGKVSNAQSHKVPIGGPTMKYKLGFRFVFDRFVDCFALVGVSGCHAGIGRLRGMNGHEDGFVLVIQLSRRVPPSSVSALAEIHVVFF